MRKLYIDCRSGISGDMMLGAFLNLGVPAVYLKQKLAGLHLREFQLQVKERQIGKTKATDVDVILSDPGNYTKDPYSGKYRNYDEIKEMLKSSDLTSQEKCLSRHIFDIKARAEAKVHHIPMGKVQFHEAGAVDSIVDIVGTAVCCRYMKTDLVISRHVPTGFGHVKCACGILPVPAPAVQQILEDTGIPYYRSDISQEVLTPTGASIIAGITDRFGWENIEGNIIRRGFGAGKRDTGLPPLELILCE